VTAELRETKQYLVSLLDSTVDAIISTDDANRVVFINQGALRMLGYLQHEILNAPASTLYAGGDEEVEYIRRKLAQLDRLQDHETELSRKDGGKVPVNVSLSCLRETHGRVRSVLAICKDITRQRQLERELKEMSMRDSLTGLYNQGCFFDRLEQEIERARRQRHPLGLLLFDVDQFKSYNDSRGHLEGDRVLRTVGRIITQSTREHVDVGFRYGGDEFTVILPEAGADQACPIAERIRKSFLNHGFDQLSLSIGMAEFDEGNSARTFVHRADAAMYEAKRAGGNRVCVCSENVSMEHREEEVFRA
jgi:diguanylate cyclase (GGDEF)-like protein/PAS domain S-box-containing protein